MLGGHLRLRVEKTERERSARETAVVTHRPAVPMSSLGQLVCVSDSPAGETKIGIDSRCPKMSMCMSTSKTFRIILGTRKILLNACRFSDKAAILMIFAVLLHSGQVGCDHQFHAIVRFRGNIKDMTALFCFWSALFRITYICMYQ